MPNIYTISFVIMQPRIRGHKNCKIVNQHQDLLQLLLGHYDQDQTILTMMTIAI